LEEHAKAWTTNGDERYVVPPLGGFFGVERARQPFTICHAQLVRLHSDVVFNPQGRAKMKKFFCLATYWLVVFLPIGLILFSMPQKRRLILAVPAGMALALFWERGLKKWKQLWHVG
jgi:hypothetical protein